MSAVKTRNRKHRTRIVRRWRELALLAPLFCGLVLPAGCKRKIAVPTVDVPPDATRTADTRPDNAAEWGKDLARVEPIGWAVNFQSADGEHWAKYPCGIMIHEMKAGMGIQPALGQTLQIAYTATLADSGKVIDSRPKDHPLEFRYGSIHIIKGLHLGLTEMRAGGHRRIYIPAALAYGAAGKLPEIPPGQDLIYDVELLSIAGLVINLPSTLPEVKPAGPPVPTTSAPATAPQ